MQSLSVQSRLQSPVLDTYLLVGDRVYPVMTGPGLQDRTVYETGLAARQGG